MLSFLIDNLWRIVATLVFIWTLLNLYIMLRVDPDEAPKWAVWSMAGWSIAWVVGLVVSIFGVIWTC